MGITGLLPFLEKASEKINVKQLANKTVAIDSYCWWVHRSIAILFQNLNFFPAIVFRLHKGAYAVADKLSRGEETDVYDRNRSYNILLFVNNFIVFNFQTYSILFKIC